MRTGGGEKATMKSEQQAGGMIHIMAGRWLSSTFSLAGHHTCAT